MKPLVATAHDFFVEPCTPHARIFGKQDTTLAVPIDEFFDGSGLAAISRTKLKALFGMIVAGLEIEKRLKATKAVLLSKNDQLQAELRDRP